MLLMYGVHGISYGQEKAPTVTPGEINTTLVVSFLPDDVSAYQIQLRKKTPQGDWVTNCVRAVSIGTGSGGDPSNLPVIGIFFRPSIGGGGIARARSVFTNLEPGTTYEARYRNTNLDECNENPPDPDPWSAIGDGTTRLVTPPRIEFVDANLAKAVRRTLKLFSSQGPHIELLKIPEAELEKLTELDASIGVDSMGIPKIPGVERPEVEIPGVEIPEPPESLLAFQTEQQDSIASILGTKIVNLTGLEHASQLTKLLLGRNQISDITPIAELTQLTELNLEENEISDITSLAQLTQLTELNLEGNHIIDIGPLAQLTPAVLGLNNNKIRDITPLSQWTQWGQLTELHLTHNQIVDVTPLAQLAGSSVTVLDLSYNQIVDVTPLAQLAGSLVTVLDLSYNQITDVTSLAALIQLEELYLRDNPIEDASPFNALLDENPGLKIDIAKALIQEQGGTTITAATRNPLTWITLHENVVTLTLSSGTFHTDEKHIANALTISGIPDIGLSKFNWYDDYIEVYRDRSGTKIHFRLSYKGDHNINTDATLNITVGSEAIAYYNGPALIVKMPVTVPTEAELTEISHALEVSTPAPLTGGTLDGNIVTLKLPSETFDFYFPHWSEYRLKNGLTISGIPSIGIHDEWEHYGIEYVGSYDSSTEIKFKLTYEGNIITTDSVLTLTVDPKAIVGYNGAPYTLEISVTGVTEAELSQAITASAPYPLTEVTLHGSTVTLKLTDAVFSTSYYFWNYIEISGIPGIARKGRRVSDTEIKFELSFSGNIDTDTALIFTVKPDGIDGYNGPSLTTEIPVSASTEVEAVGELVASSAFPLTKATLNGSVVKLTLQNKSYQGSSYDYDEPVIGISGISGIKTEWLGSGSYLWILSKTEIWVWLGGFTGNLDTDAMLTFTVPPSLIKDYNGPPLAATLPITVKTGKQMLVSEDSRLSMYWINTDTHKIESLDPFDAVTNQVASLTVDTADDKVYWSEHSSSGGVIKRANLDGTNVEVLVTHPTTPQSITVDTAGKRFCWINSLEGKIQSADLSGGNIKTIVQLDDTITHIAVDAEGGKLYWADSEFRIRRMNLDGTGIETVLTGWNSYLPRGIGGMVIADGKIYWTERQIWYRVGGIIHRANLNGTNLETLATSLGEPVGIAVDTVEGKVYWTNSYGGIQRMDINGGEIENVVYGIAAPGDFALGTAIPSTTLTTPETSADTGVVVSISPASVASPAVGEQLELSLKVTGGEAVAGYQATVEFNETALRYVSGANGDFLPAGAFFVQPVVEGTLIKLNAASLAGESNGDGTLATLAFEVVAAKASTLTLSDVLLTNSVGETFVPQLEDAEITEPTALKGDVNRDGTVNIADLVLVASNLGKTGQNAADVNSDGQVNIADLVLVAGALGTSAAAPSLHPYVLEVLTATQVKQWLSAAQHLDPTDTTSQHGILFLQQLLAALTPKETALLSNYPNPFNPETWIPYHLEKDADVTLHIYAVNGTLVRKLTLGPQAAGMYQSRSRAAYWDGKNEFGEPVASGVYFYTLIAGDFSATRKMLIQK